MKAEKDKLEILQSLDHFRTWRYWKSLDDQRVCILCEKKFNGHEVQITRSDNGKYELQCPTKDCNSGPHQWVYPDAPLVPDTTEPDWWGYSPKAGTQIRDKLQALQSLDHFRIWRYWKSLDDQRVCFVCEKKFNGHEVQITRSENGTYQLHCPTKDCNSGPHQWVYPDAPQIPDTNEPGWWGYSPKTGPKIGGRISSARLSGSAASESWDYSPKAAKPARSDGDDRRARRHRPRKRRRKPNPRTARAP